MHLRLKTVKETLKESYLLSTIFCFARQYVISLLRKKGKEPVRFEMPGAEFSLRVAIICDEMTWQNCKPLFRELYYLTPENWRKTLEQYTPDLLFCESAWHGINEVGHVWNGRIFKNHKVLFENRSVLLDIMAYCRNRKIPTVFWNKEDPAFYHTPKSDFADTALLFDHIFTTAQECVPRYKEEGHQHVHVMQFGFSPHLFNPLGRNDQNSGAVFAGSWFSEHRQRCEEMHRMFGWLKKHSIPLTIFDREYAEGKSSSFPVEYQECVRPALAYEKTGEIYRKYKFGVNINTVMNSESMFARRVYEMIACGLPVVSNASVGIRNRFGDGVIFIEDPDAQFASAKTTHRLVRDVFLHDTFDTRMKYLLETIGMSQVQVIPTVDVFCIGNRAQEIFSEIDWPAKTLIPISDETGLTEAITKANGQYGIILIESSACPDIRFLITQFAFLPEECGVSESEGDLYQIKPAKHITNVLWLARALKKQVTCTVGTAAVYHA